MTPDHSTTYQTRGGIQVRRHCRGLPMEGALDPIIRELDAHHGVLFSSGCDYPGRYRPRDIGFVRPPLQVVARGRELEVRALNRRGRVLLPPVEACLRGCAAVQAVDADESALRARVRLPAPMLYEAERSRRHSVVSVLRELIALFASPADALLGLYGAFGYDLAFQFEAVEARLERDSAHRDLVLYLPDQIVVVDHRKEQASACRYEFAVDGQFTADLPCDSLARPFVPAGPEARAGCDHQPGEYARTVRRALDCFRRGDLFEAVPGQMFTEPCRDGPAAVYRRLRSSNPAPYGALINLGEGEYLVSASPEMYVRVTGRRVETCPISGTIARGRDSLEDAEQILKLLNSDKDRAELSMCTDVDRNDKARVCVPGSVRVIGRRQVELYSRLIHTVDHVEGRLDSRFDALDAFLTHAWAVTVTGAPKPAAMQFIEAQEKSPRRWYGGAMGMLHFNGDMNTGLTLRTIHIEQGMARVRAGATLLADSDAEAEEAETRLKASALLDAVRGAGPAGEREAKAVPVASGAGLEVLMVDHRDSFVHSLAAYFEAAGARVSTVRSECFAAAFAAARPDLVVLSPGPGRPRDFHLDETIARVLECKIPIFGVCLGLQGIVEFFGGGLRLLAQPMHGKSSRLERMEGPLFEGLDEGIRVGRYHSLAADTVPDCLRVTAASEDGTVMAVAHRELPVSALQFHPESILSLRGDAGQRIITNLLAQLAQGTRQCSTSSSGSGGEENSRSISAEEKL